MLISKKDEEIQLVKQKVSNKCENVVADLQASDAFLTITFDEFFKGFELLRRWMMKHHSKAIDYFDLNFEDIHKEMMANEDTERANADGQEEGGGVGESLGDAQVALLDKTPVDPPIDQAVDLDVVNSTI